MTERIWEKAKKAEIKAGDRVLILEALHGTEDKIIGESVVERMTPTQIVISGDRKFGKADHARVGWPRNDGYGILKWFDDWETALEVNNECRRLQKNAFKLIYDQHPNVLKKVIEILKKGQEPSEPEMPFELVETLKETGQERWRLGDKMAMRTVFELKEGNVVSWTVPSKIPGMEISTPVELKPMIVTELEERRSKILKALGEKIKEKS